MSARGREVAHRLFAAEFEDATYSYTESDEERAPKYIVSPTGAQINRLFVVGVLTAVERVNEDTLRARIVDPTGAFVVYASQYQPDARAELEGIDPPAFVAVTGKGNTFRPDGSDRIYSSVRPEAVAVVDADTRDRWTVNTAERTLVRLGRLASALRGAESSTNGIALAISEYEPTHAYVAAMFDTCVDALRLVAGEIETIDSADVDLQAADTPEHTLEYIASVGASIEAESTGQTIPSAPAPQRVQPGLENGDATQQEPSEEESVPAEETEATESDDAEVEEPMEPSEPVLSEEDRDSIEEEFGASFTTGDEVESVPESAPQDTEAEPREEAEESPTDQVVELLRTLNGSEGVDRETLLEQAAEQLGYDAQTVEDALEGALMEGRCYESDTDVFKPI